MERSFGSIPLLSYSLAKPCKFQLAGENNHLRGALPPWEYPYNSDQAQEDLSDRLVPASLYGLKVARPSYCSADGKPATATQALAAFDGRKGFVDHVCDTDVNAHTTPVGQVGQGHLGAALYVCTQPECKVAGGHELLFATLEQRAAH